MTISTTFVLFLIWTLYPKFSRKLLPLLSSLILLSNSLSSSFQSAYRMAHSIETTLRSVPNDLDISNRSLVRSLLLCFLIYIPADFDIVDHSILLHRLRNCFGLYGTSLDWFLYHLTSRSQTQSGSKIPLHLSQIFLVVYLKVPSLTHFFTLII